MRERIAALGGHVEVGGATGSDAGHGTVVEVSVPVAGTAEDGPRPEKVGGS
jgi:signal transduction histidine kinase